MRDKFRTQNALKYKKVLRVKNRFAAAFAFARFG